MKQRRSGEAASPRGDGPPTELAQKVESTSPSTGQKVVAKAAGVQKAQKAPPVSASVAAALLAAKLAGGVS